MPDHAIPLTPRGHEMAQSAGVALREAMEKVYGSPEAMGHCRMWVSPFRRTRETALGVLTEAGGWVSDVQQSPYLAEQACIPTPHPQIPHTHPHPDIGLPDPVAEHSGVIYRRLHGQDWGLFPNKRLLPYMDV